MKFHKTLGIFALIVLPVTSFALFGFSSPKPTASSNEGPPLTAAQRQQVLDSINGISTRYGDFVRVHKLGNFPKDEIAYSVTDVNQNTQEIIFPYGIFDKTTPEQEKADELKDPQWTEHHHLYQSDVSIIQTAIASHEAPLKASNSN